jgi:hypothetical protein
MSIEDVSLKFSVQAQALGSISDGFVQVRANSWNSLNLVNYGDLSTALSCVRINNFEGRALVANSLEKLLKCDGF